MSKTEEFTPWQVDAWRQLCRYRQQERLPQALLIHGNAGMGKLALARRFADMLLCLQPKAETRCGECQSCHLTDVDNHPDLFVIQPEEQKSSISVNQIRSIVADTSLKPQYQASRVIIIHPADIMSLSAANAFLKCLEEPNERTIFLLVSAKPQRLPITIASRCQKLAVTYPDKSQVLAWLLTQGSMDHQETLANLLMASMMRPDQLDAPEDTLTRRQQCFKDWQSVANSTYHPALIAEKWLKYPTSVTLDWLISWSSDVIKCQLGANQRYLCNTDLQPQLSDLAKRSSAKGTYAIYDLMLGVRNAIDTQINVQMMYEEILIKWQQLNSRIHHE